MEKIHLLMSSDNNYVQHLGVTLISVFENTEVPDNFHVTVLDGGIFPEQKNLLKGIAQKYDAAINFREVKLDNPEKFIVNGHVSIAAYYRVLLPLIYGPEVRKAIYLDCDVIVNHDLNELFKVDLNGFVVGAVKELSNKRMVELGFPDKPYFNSGVLLINYQEWLEQNTTQEVLDFIFANPEKLVYWDQDALNACLVDKWMELDYQWNYLREFVEINKNWKNRKKFIPHIVHFSNNTKPWHYYSRNPYDYLYYKYLGLSPWKGFHPLGKNFRKVVAKNVKLTLRKGGILKGM